MKKSRLKVAATLTVHRASDMTPLGRKQVAQWLREQARFLVRSGADYSRRYTARYYYRERNDQ